MRPLTKLASGNSEQLDAVVALAKVLAKADSNFASALTDVDLLADIADVVAALVAKETKALSNRIKLLEVASGSPKVARAVNKGRAKAVKL